jgi:hypothetical protein
MHSFPEGVIAELEELFSSAYVDERGASFPFTQSWILRSIGFESWNNRNVIVIVEDPSGQTLEVELDAEDYAIPQNSGNESSYSDLAFDISVLAQEEVFTRDRNEFSQSRVVLTPEGIAEGLREFNLGAALGAPPPGGWRVRRAKSL